MGIELGRSDAVEPSPRQSDTNRIVVSRRVWPTALLTPSTTLVRSHGHVHRSALCIGPTTPKSIYQASSADQTDARGIGGLADEDLANMRRVKMQARA